MEQARACAAEHPGIRAALAPYARPPPSPPSPRPLPEVGPAGRAEPGGPAGPGGAPGSLPGPSVAQADSHQAGEGKLPLTHAPSADSEVPRVHPDLHSPKAELPQAGRLPAETVAPQSGAGLPTPTPPVPGADARAGEGAPQAGLQVLDGPALAGRTAQGLAPLLGRALNYQAV